MISIFVNVFLFVVALVGCAEIGTTPEELNSKQVIWSVSGEAPSKALQKPGHPLRLGYVVTMFQQSLVEVDLSNNGRGNVLAYSLEAKSESDREPLVLAGVQTPIERKTRLSFSLSDVPERFVLRVDYELDGTVHQRSYSIPLRTSKNRDVRTCNEEPCYRDDPI